MTERPTPRAGRPVAVVAWVVVGAVMVALAAVAVSRVLVSGAEEPGEATSVRDVADLATDVAEQLDVGAGVALLCERPLDLYRMAVESTIARWQDDSEDDDSLGPEVEAEVDDVPDGAAGSFVLTLRGDEAELGEGGRDWRVFVESRDGRSCVTGVGGVDDDEPTTRFFRDGYGSVSSPAPAPRTTEPAAR